MTEQPSAPTTDCTGLGTVAVAHLHPGRLSTHFQHSLEALFREDPSVIYPPLRIKSTIFLGPARNSVVRMFLDATSHDWLLMVDADMGFAPDTVQRLKEAADPDERPVVGALCFIFDTTGVLADHRLSYHVRPTIYQQAEGSSRLTPPPLGTEYPTNALVKCAGTGAACVLMHRTALQRMRDEYGDNWYTMLFDEVGTGFAEDLAFCVRASRLDIPIFVHTGVRTCHAKAGYAHSGWNERRSGPPAPPEVIITGSFHSRLGWTAALLRSCLVDCGDEFYWNLGRRPLGQGRVDVSWVAVTHLAELEGEVLHQVRHPMRTLESVLASRMLDPPGWMTRRALMGTCPEMGDQPPIEAAMLAIAACVEAAEERSVLTWRVEDLDVGLLTELCERLGHTVSEPRARDALEQDTTTLFDPPTPLTADDLPTGQAKDRFLSLVERFGYHPEEGAPRQT